VSTDILLRGTAHPQPTILRPRRIKP
jgi:hypothetical protein